MDFARVFRIAGEAMVIVDAVEGRIVGANDQAGVLFGHPPAALVGRFRDTLLAVERPGGRTVSGVWHPARPDRQVTEALAQRADGTQVAVEVSSVGCDMDGAPSIISVVRDISRQAAVESALGAAYRRIQGILSSMVDAVATTDARGVITGFNPAAERLLGWPAEAVLGQSLALLLPSAFIGDDGRTPERICGRLKEIADGCGREAAALRLDGMTVAVELAVSVLAEEPLGTLPEPLPLPAPDRTYVVVIRDQSTYKMAEAALRTAKSQAEIANRVKTEFLGNMSHDLRTPLNAIIGFSEILKSQMFGPLAPRYVDYAGTILESGQYLLRIIDSLLDMARIEAGRYELQEEDISLSDVVETCRDAVTAEADARGVVLVAEEVPPLLPLLKADRMAIFQVLLNLLSNAVKFSAAGGRVSVRIQPEASGDIALVVADTGVGIAEEQLATVFEPFHQIGRRLERGLGGAGLGLSIAKSLMELHGGSLMLSSKVGVGTTAVARFPIVRLVPA